MPLASPLVLPKLVKRRFWSAAWPPNETAELVQRCLGRFCGYDWRFRTAVLAADHNRRTNPETSGIKWRFHSAVRATDQTAVSPILLKPREKPRAFSNDNLRTKPSTQGACVDIFEQHRETNYKTQEHITIYNKKVQVWKVTCEENAHKCKYAKCVCALNLFKEN